MQIRPTRVADAEALTELHLSVWEEAYAGLIPDSIFAERRARHDERLANWRRILAGYTNTQLVAVAPDGRLLGFASADSGRDTSSALPPRELMALYVRAEVWGTGVGHGLLTEAIGTAPAYLWVLDSNRRAIDFYARQGFDFDGATRTDQVGLERRMVR